MKALCIIAIIVLLSQSKCEYCGSDYIPTKREDCTSLPFGEDYYKCCYAVGEIEGQSDKEIKCHPVKKEEYDNFDKFLKDFKETCKQQTGKTVKDLSVDCNSNYVMISLMSLIFLLF